MPYTDPLQSFGLRSGLNFSPVSLPGYSLQVEVQFWVVLRGVFLLVAYINHQYYGHEEKKVQEKPCKGTKSLVPAFEGTHSPGFTAAALDRPVLGEAALNGLQLKRQALDMTRSEIGRNDPLLLAELKCLESSLRPMIRKDQQAWYDAWLADIDDAHKGHARPSCIES